MPAASRTGFTLLTPESTGIFFTNQLSYIRSETNQNLLNGAGLAAGDFDGDGLCDLYFCSLEGPNGLFRNRGDWNFEDVTRPAGVVAMNHTSRGALFADINGDRHLDLIVSSLCGSNACYLNTGQGRFTNSARSAGLSTKPAGGHSVCMADIDGDNDLDLYLANYGENSILRSGGTISVRTVNGKQVIRGRYAERLKIIDGQLIEYGEPHELYLNNGKGFFTAVSWTDGTFTDDKGAPLTAAPWDMGLSAMFRDINGDRFPDLYVCNDFQTPDRIWINDGKGRFRAIAAEAIRSTPHFSMGVDFADIDRDGRDDFFVCDMLSRSLRLRLRQTGATNPPVSVVGEDLDRHQFRRNGLYLNRGDGTYAEIANYAGLDASDWSWSTVFLDVDLDGFEDLLVVNGHAYDTQDLDMADKGTAEAGPAAMGMRIGKNLKDYPPLHTPNVVFRNKGDRTFEEVGKRWGFTSTNVSHGIALADFDNDGDQDVAVSCLWKPPLLYRNESTAPRIAIRLRGLAPNTHGIGASIKVVGGPVPQTQQVMAGGRYLSGDEPLRTFAAGTKTNRLRVEVTWRNGRVSVVPNAQADCIYEIDEAGAGPAEPFAAAPSAAVWMADVSSQLGHTHTDEPFCDFDRQPLLHKHLSTLGPGVSWQDIDGDGDDDLLVGCGRTGRLAFLENKGSGRFESMARPIWRGPDRDDLTAVVGASFTDRRAVLVVGQATYEEAAASQTSFALLDARSGLAVAMPPASAPPPAGAAAGKPARSSTGALALCDVDNDGDLDLFVAGRVIPGRYPEAAASELYLNTGTAFVLDRRASPALQKLGMVSGCVFSDLDNDGIGELLLACEWGPVKVLKNQSGNWRDVTSSLGLDPHTGWWQGVTTGDVDGDGDLDIVASNWGLNSSYLDPGRTPVQTIFTDIDANSTLDLFEACTDMENNKVLPRRDLLVLGRGWPLARTRFASHKAYSQADLGAVLGKPLNTLPTVKVTTLASMCFLNKGSRFEAVALPAEAQFAPAFGVNVADFDGDGKEDLFLAQNFFDMRADEPRLDAGRGLILRGLGGGRFEPVSAQVSGIRIYGQQRGSAVADFDGDARVDLAVGQNRGATRLFHNQSGRPGLRVRLKGPALNSSAVGAVIQLVFGDEAGPAREVRAGSGYWSQDSAVQVMATPSAPTAVKVVWPGGQKTTSKLAAAAREIVVDGQGNVQMVP